MGEKKKKKKGGRRGEARSIETCAFTSLMIRKGATKTECLRRLRMEGSARRPARTMAGIKREKGKMNPILQANRRVFPTKDSVTKGKGSRKDPEGKMGCTLKKKRKWLPPVQRNMKGKGGM